MSQPFPSEQLFDSGQLGPQLGLLDPGLLLLRAGRTTAHCYEPADQAQPEATPGDASRIAHPPPIDRHLTHLALPPEESVTQALATVADHCTIAVAIHAGGDADPVRLAVAFGEHLATHRHKHHPNPIAPCITATAAPDLPDHDGLVRIPHLLTVRHPAGLVDTAVWELMTRQQAIQWLGGPLPDLKPFEVALPALLSLRQRARADTLPATPAGQRLRMLLVDRYLSIRLVYRYPQLFTELLFTVAPHHTETSGAQ